MLHHMSFSVHDTDHVAQVLAEMLGIVPIAAPSPPFPKGSWFLCFGDAAGTMLQMTPEGLTFDPDAPFGLHQGAPGPWRSAAHAYVSVPTTRAQVETIAAREGWRCDLADTGPFQVINVWVENHFLLEVATPELLPAYIATFNAAGIARLNRDLRTLEKELMG